MREKGADTKIFVEIIRDAAGEKIRARDTIGRERKVSDDLGRDDGIARLHVEQGEVPFADAAVEFDAGINRDLRAVEQADVAAEEGNELRRFAGEAEAEIVLIGALEKKGALLWKEEREAREINLARVDFGFCEVSVSGEDGDKLRSGFPGDFSAGSGLPTARALAVEFARFADAVGSDFDAKALLQLAQAGQSSGAAQIVEKRIESWRGPAQREALAGYVTLEVESPFGEAFGETEGSRGDNDFGGPAVGGSRGAGVPYAIPIERGGLRIGDEAVGASASSIDLKEVAGATVAVSVEDDTDRVVGKRGAIAAHGFVAAHGVNGKTFGMRVLTFEAKIDAVVCDDDADRRLVGRGCTGLWRLLREGERLCFAPDGFVEAAVESDGSGRANESGGMRRGLRSAARRAGQAR